MQTLVTRQSNDLDILRLKAETNRLEIAAYLALSELEQIEASMRSLVQDLKDHSVVPSDGDARKSEE